MLRTWSCLRAGVDAFVRRFLLLFGAWLVILALHQLIDLLTPEAWVWVGLLAQIVLLAPLYTGQYLLALKVVREEPASLRDLFRGYCRCGTLVVVSVLVSLLVAVGFFLLIIPGIFWALTFAFAPVVVLNQRSRGDGSPRIGAIAALRRSKDLTEGHRDVLFGVSFLLGLPLAALAVLTSVATFTPEIGIPLWAIQLFALLSGTLFLGPV